MLSVASKSSACISLMVCRLSGGELAGVRKRCMFFSRSTMSSGSFLIRRGISVFTELRNTSGLKTHRSEIMFLSGALTLASYAQALRNLHR